MATLTSDNTPLQYGTAGNYRFRQTLYTKREVHRLLATDMNLCWVGPFSPEMFMEELMGISDADLSRMPKGVKFKFPPRNKEGGSIQEKRLYQAFADSIARYDLSPHMPFFICADKKRKNGDSRPDAGLKEFHKIAATHPYATRSKSKSAKTLSVVDSRRFDWCLDTLVVEFKSSSIDDPFYPREELEKQLRKQKGDTKIKPAFEKPGEYAARIRGQLAMYAREMFNHQQRTHIFQLLITGRHARFIYFDHSGAIVTDAFDYMKHPAVLAEFFWRTNYMTDEARGMDTTATVAGSRDRKAFTAVVEQLLGNMQDENHPQRAIPDAELTLDGDYPVYKIAVEEVLPVELEEGERAVPRRSNEEGRKEETLKMELLIQRPVFNAVSPLGRATRGYIAVQVEKRQSTTSKEEEKEALFLKDTWRINHPLLKAESEVYRLLEKYGVSRIPRLICGGDVRNAEGRVQKTICAEWAERQTLTVSYSPLRLHMHHRLVQRLAYPIESAKDSKEMVQAFYNVLIVIEEVYEKTPGKMLHRDVSSGNVMIGEPDEDDVGLLGDWDHASETNPDPRYEHQKFRTGTWAFMSIALLRDPQKIHEIADDLEAMFWTLIYSALHTFKHEGKFNMDAFNWHWREFRQDGVATGRVTGGTLKRAALADFSVAFDCKPLQRLIVELADALDSYYMAIDSLKKAERNAEWNPSRVPIAREKLDEQHAIISTPRFWREIFERALAASEWIPDVEKEKTNYPQRTEEHEVQAFEFHSRTSFQSGAHPEVPLTAEPVTRATGEDYTGGAESSCDEGDEDDEDEDENEDFPLIPDADKAAAAPDQSPSSPPPPPPKTSLLSRSESSSSLSSVSSDESVHSSPSSRPKRTRREYERGVAGPSSRPLSKRLKSSSDMLPPPLPPVPTARRTVGRSGTTRRQQSSGSGANADGRM